MKRLLFFLPALALFLGACSQGAPDLALDFQEIDIGEVTNGEIRTIEVPLVNRGDEVLEIQNVSTSCGCTSGRVAPNRLAPNEQGVLIIQYDSGAHGPDANGLVTRQVFIASNDPDQPEVTFEFTADVLPAAP